MTCTASADQTTSLFEPLARCWICGGADLHAVHQGLFEFSLYAQQDPELAAYSGRRFWLMRCRACGFGQPDVLPTLPYFFKRMYDQRWSDDWIENEFHSTCKDRIFEHILGELARRCPPSSRTLLDVGAHAGRFLFLAKQAGWHGQGIELNPRTAEFAARSSGCPVHQSDAAELARTGHQFAAITLTDVLEHIADPVPVLTTLRSLLAPGGWLAVKVPCGPLQLVKEKIRSWLRPGYRVSVADNLVHVNHFSPQALRHALVRAGFEEIHLTVGMPEIPPSVGRRARWSSGFRLAVCHLAGWLGAGSPLALNLQAFARNPAGGQT